MWSVDIDGSDITGLCQNITWHPKLNRPASLSVRVPGHLVSVTNGVSEMHLTNGSLLFSGPVWMPEDQGDADATYTVITAYDHLIYLPKRMAKTPIDYPDYDPPDEPGPCSLADPSKVLADFSTAPEIMAAFLQATLDCDPPAARGGPGGAWFLSVGSVAAGGPDMTGVPADWPMNLEDFSNMLLETGQLNMIVNPGIGSSVVDFTNGGVENDLTGSVSLDYGTGNFNSQAATKSSDMDEVTSALWYVLGPKRPWYTGDIAHYAGSITPTAPNAGPDGDGGEPGDPWPPALVARWMGAQAAYGYMQEIQIHDSGEDEQITARPLFEEMYANEAYIRAVPRLFTGITPERAYGSSPTFFPGDLISVSAGSQLGGGYSGSVLVYEYEISVDADGVAEYTQLVASPDAQ